jgi:hypothetical protein
VKGLFPREDYRIGRRAYVKSKKKAGYIISVAGDFSTVIVRFDDGDEDWLTAIENVLLGGSSNGIHDGLTFGFGKLDGHGYWEIPDYGKAREMEIEHRLPINSYWPFQNVVPPVDATVLASDQLNATRMWFIKYRGCLTAETHIEYDTQLENLLAHVSKMRTMEILLKAAHEFMTGEWEPDDVDRAKFVRRLAEFDV